MPRVTDNDLDPSIKIGSDLLGSAMVAYLLSQEDTRKRRVALNMLAMSGIDGVIKLLAARPITPLQAAYQVPWVILGVVACRWMIHPPRIGGNGVTWKL
jgi:hypothetical protein